MLNRLAQNWRRYGVMASLDLLFDRLVYRVLGIEVVQVVWLDVADLRQAPRKDSRFTFRSLSADEVHKFAADPANQFPDRAAQRAASGHNLCFAALDGNRLAAYGWYALASPEAKHVYPTDVAYVSEGRTLPDYRGDRLHGATMGLALQQLADRGVTKLLASVHWTNTASLRSCTRIGYVCLGRRWTIPLGSREVVTTPHRARRLGVRFKSTGTLPPRRSAMDPSVLDGRLAGARGPLSGR